MAVEQRVAAALILKPAHVFNNRLGARQNFGKKAHGKAVQGYRLLLPKRKSKPAPWRQLKNQVFLGSDKFVEDTQCLLSLDQSLHDIPKPQKLAPPKLLQYYVDTFAGREGMARASLSWSFYADRSRGCLSKELRYR
ncbi:MAG: hypothetical protein U5M23_12650 [Marinagarivorans sp.]|nr:hypothetical protein [Marinagarivorans sp.]